MEEKNSMSNTELLEQINNNRNDLFDAVNVRIQNRLLQDEIEKKKKEEEKKLKIQLNTEKAANAIISLIYKILTEADQKYAVINHLMVDPILGKPYNESIGDTEPSHYSFDDDGLTIYLNYSCESIDLSAWGGTSFLRDYNYIDVDYLQELLNNNNVEFCLNNDSYRDTSVDIEIVTIRVKRNIKNNSKEYCKKI